MSRPLRLEFPEALYHLTSRGGRRENIYEDDEDSLAFLEVFSSVIEQFNWVCYAYCLMSNHYHLLVQAPDAQITRVRYKLKISRRILGSRKAVNYD